jgi:hypothetical protein
VKNHARLALGAAALLWCSACGGSGSATTTPAAVATAAPAPSATATTTTTTTTTTTSATAYTCPTAQTSSGPLDCTDLPLGDLKESTTPHVGSIDECTALSGSPVVATAPWLNTSAKTWNALTKSVVAGSVTWAGTFTDVLSNAGASLTVSGNLLPIDAIPTGTFPIATTDPAYQYDHNPNSIAAHTFSVALPGDPVPAASPTCLGGGTIGVTLTGVAIYNGFDGAGYDAVAREIQDGCHGHPDQSDTYHYHGWLQACVPDLGSATQNSSLLGYALDGFGIYGPWYGGKILTTADLDACHGTTSPVLWNGVLTTIYHYVSTYDFPYTVGCYKGTPVKAL